MFKKRSRPASVRDKPRTEDVEEEQASGSATPAGEDEDNGHTVEELILLRKLKKSQTHQGIDLEKLNRGADPADRAKAARSKTEQDIKGADAYGIQKGGLSGGGGGDKDDDLADETEKVKRLVRANNFTGQTNALDVDKHMTAFIENELAKRRGQAAATTSENPEPYDPQAELYKIAEKYQQLETSKKKKVDDDEGNVTNSLGMLTSIPEVDLGMDNRLRNIEETEKAKRAMMELRKQEAAAAAAAAREAEDPGYAAARFYRPNQRVASDLYTSSSFDKKPHVSNRPETATDEQVYERFKKRMKK
ncbi:hypothetical protein B9479_002718 [Cryptococcus floricola]|uniref:Uncharacterized protein n=1 Tax=Cryptococcus floricola TaxID=2591691 RepID=A0A5D3B325_9TREE|nr:hypothetical protein B9479_002718 [Cryptococcus floricola]